jgi:hypothetical protein
MIKKGKKVKVWGKIKLYETSVVGIPAYPDAHLSTNKFSLTKALSELGDELNLEETTMPEEKTQAESQPSLDSEETTPVGSEEAKEEKQAVPLTQEDVSAIVTKAVKEALKSAETERGLIDKEKSIKDKLKNKSLGEMAIMQGLFVKKD